MKTPDLHAPQEIKKKADVITCELRSKGLSQYKNLIDGLHMLPGIMRAKLDPIFLANLLGINPKDLSEEITAFEVQWQIRRRGVENRLIIGDPVPQPDQTLIRMLVRAHQWVQDMRAGVSLKQIAYRESVTAAYIRTRSRLAFLSPQIQKAILTGLLPPEFTTNRILQMKIPLDWQRQNNLFGL